VPYTGGHEHHDALRPKGSCSPSSINISAGQTGPEKATYSSNIVSGADTIRLKVDGEEQKSLAMGIGITILGEMPSSNYWRLTGETAKHPDNHYAVVSTIANMAKIAREYYELTDTTLGINDMSLKWGGLFDIYGNWSTPHSTHRTGEDVDIDRNVWDTIEGQYVLMNCEDDKELRESVTENHGSLLCEHGGKKHIDY
jgi:hypothetical protein